MNKQALIANFTGLTGHYGMLGTSLAIVEELLSRGYDVSTIGTDETRLLGDASSRAVVEFTEEVRRKAALADIVFVNGEGTLHGWRPSSIALLQLIELLLEYSSAPVHLANFSCLPGSTSVEPVEQDARYREVLKAVQSRGRIVVRDRMSAAVLTRLGIQHEIGFDSLPLFASRHFGHLRHAPGNRVIVSAGAGMQPQSIKRLAVLMETCFDARYELVYLSGGTDMFVDADRRQYQQMCAVLRDIQFVRAETAAQFMTLLSQDVHVVITGRFHYAIAARSLSSPCFAWRSNTIKTEAVADQLGLLDVFSDRDFDYERTQRRLREFEPGPQQNDSATLRALALKNYEAIAPAGQARPISPSSWQLYGRLLRNAGIAPAARRDVGAPLF